jgi:hypothetical protein
MNLQSHHITNINKGKTFFFSPAGHQTWRTRRTHQRSSKNPDGFFSFLGFDNPRNFEIRQVIRPGEREERIRVLRRILMDSSHFSGLITLETSKSGRSSDLENEKNASAFFEGTTESPLQGETP